MTVRKNTQTLIELLGTEERPISLLEFVEFWKSLTEAEKRYYRSLESN